MNITKAAQALTDIADAFYILSEALTEQPAVAGTSAGVPGAGVVPPASAPDGLPELPPIEEEWAEGAEWAPADTDAPVRALPVAKEYGSQAVCPKHKTPFKPSKFAGKPAYCTQRSDGEPNWTSPTGYCSITEKSAIAWLKQHAAVPA